MVQLLYSLFSAAYLDAESSVLAAYCHYLFFLFFFPPLRMPFSYMNSLPCAIMMINSHFAASLR